MERVSMRGDTSGHPKDGLLRRCPDMRGLRGQRGVSVHCMLTDEIGGLGGKRALRTPEPARRSDVVASPSLGTLHDASCRKDWYMLRQGLRGPK